MYYISNVIVRDFGYYIVTSTIQPHTEHVFLPHLGDWLKVCHCLWKVRRLVQG